MLNDLHDLLVERLATIVGFSYIGTALQDDQEKRPDAMVWLEEDSEVIDSPGRQLTWGIRLSVGHSATIGASQTVVYNLIDAFRTAFALWQPAGVTGIQPKSLRVQKIKLIGHESHGSTIYAATVVFIVFPVVFTNP